MSDWFESLTTLQQIFAFIAVPATVVLILQTILLFFGIGGGGGVDLDVSDVGGISGAEVPDFDASELPDGSDVDGLTVFSIRGIVAMLCVGGWSGIALLDTTLPPVVAVIIAVLLGVAALIGMAYLLRALMKLQASGNIMVESAIGKIGKVYLTVPAERKGSGKIHITVQETYTEFEAVTDDVEPIKTGESVEITAVDESGRLIVTRNK
jgi:membrane protein implicated in regulation of membrane protease activity